MLITCWTGQDKNADFHDFLFFLSVIRTKQNTVIQNAFETKSCHYVLQANISYFKGNLIFLL